MKDEIVGKVFSTNKSGDCVVTKYVGCNEVYVKFLNTGFERVTDTNSLRNGQVKDTSLSKTVKKYVVGKENIVGRVFENNKGEQYEVLEKLSTTRFKVKFAISGYETEVKKIAIEVGEIKDRKSLNKDKEAMLDCFFDPKLNMDFHVVELTHRKGERKLVVESFDGTIRLTTDREKITNGEVSVGIDVLPVDTKGVLPFSKVDGVTHYEGEQFSKLTEYLANVFFYINSGKLYHRYISLKTLTDDFKAKLQHQSYGVEIVESSTYVTILGVKFYVSDVVKLLNGETFTVDCVSKQESMVVNLGLEHEYSLWLTMTNRCKNGYAKLGKEFEVFWDWLSWAKQQKGFMCRDVNGKLFEMDSDLFSGEKTYAPNTVVFIPNSLNQMCKPTKRGSMPKGIQYFEEKVKPYRVYRPYGGKQKHLGYYETLEQAVEAALKGRKEHLNSLKELYGDSVDHRVFDELMKDKWVA